MKLFFFLHFSLALLLSADISILSKTKVENNWQIHYEIKPKQVVNKTLLTYNGKDINNAVITFPHAKLSSAVLFLIDTSAPMKKEFNKGIKPVIKEMFTLKQSWDKWAIAGFSDEIKIFGDYNQTTADNALNKITVSGQRTELFRASLEAMESLKSVDAARKFLFIFSDGEAEDNAYKLEEVFTKAKELNITIISFGYKDSIHLQSLRRISEETGGKIYIADKRSYKLPQTYLNDLNASLSNNSLISFSADILKPNLQGSVSLELKTYFENNTSASKSFSLSVEKITTPLVEEKSFFIYYIVAVLLALIILFFIFKPKKEENEKDAIELEPIAYLQSASGSKEYIYKTHNSIGALVENDIVIEGEYISRRHATLDLKDGEFYLIDNNSANKVFINYKEISSSIVKDGDIVSFGPYEVTFKNIQAN